MNHVELNTRLRHLRLSGMVETLPARQAGITQIKEFSDFDFTFNPKIPKAKLLDLATGRFVATSPSSIVHSSPPLG